jgi:alpha-ketoglutarate-dependent taurine dioxygenase
MSAYTNIDEESNIILRGEYLLTAHSKSYTSLLGVIDIEPCPGKQCINVNANFLYTVSEVPNVCAQNLATITPL